MVNFRDYGIKGVEPKTTYVLTLLQPQGTDVEEQELVINYQPATAMVLIDSKPIRGNGRVERSLPLGQHSYMIAAEGYITAEGTVKLNGGPAIVLPITLAKENTPSVKETAPAKEEKTTPTAEDTNNGLQAVKVTFDTDILFATGSSTLTVQGKESLSNLANVLKSNPDCDVAVFGYTDNSSWKNCTKKQSAKKIRSFHRNALWL